MTGRLSPLLHSPTGVSTASPMLLQRLTAPCRRHQEAQEQQQQEWSRCCAVSYSSCGGPCGTHRQPAVLCCGTSTRQQAGAAAQRCVAVRQSLSMGGVCWMISITWRAEARTVLKGGNAICLQNHHTMLSGHQPLYTCSTVGMLSTEECMCNFNTSCRQHDTLSRL